MAETEASHPAAASRCCILLLRSCQRITNPAGETFYVPLRGLPENDMHAAEAFRLTNPEGNLPEGTPKDRYKTGPIVIGHDHASGGVGSANFADEWMLRRYGISYSSGAAYHLVAAGAFCAGAATGAVAIVSGAI